MLSLACVGWTGQHSVWGVQQPSRNKSAGVNSGPKSRALETDASRLNGRPHGVSGSSRSFCRWRSQLGIGYELISNSPGAEPFKPPLHLPPIDSLRRSENQHERNPANDWSECWVCGKSCLQLAPACRVQPQN